MPRLKYGVKVMPYGHIEGNSKDPNVTTADVAHRLEDRYHIMEHFHEMYEEQIDDIVTNQIGIAVENAVNGNMRAARRLFEKPLDDLKPLFQDMINQRRLDGITGVPTQASLAGKSKRRKGGYIKNKKGQRVSRPSFKDTHLYMQSFVCWID